MKPSRLLLIGGIMVVLGFLVPLLMVVDVIPMVLWLEFIVALIQIFGLILGIMGSVMMVKEKQHKNDRY